MATASLLLAANAANTLVWAHSQSGNQGKGHGQGRPTSPVVSVSSPHGGHAGKQKGHPEGKPEPHRPVTDTKGAILEGVVQKVYGTVAKLNAYESITLGTGLAHGQTGEKGKKAKKAKPNKGAAAEARDLRSAEHLLSAAVKQLNVTVTKATYGTETVTGSTYGTTPTWVGTALNVETALKADADALSGMASGGDVSSIITALRTQITVLQAAQGSLPASTEGQKRNRHKG
jgi:hypothetical protein